VGGVGGGKPSGRGRQAAGEGGRLKPARSWGPPPPLRPRARARPTHGPGPSDASCAHPRFTIQGNKVNWLGWSFLIGNKATSGPRLWDIRFKGDRIIYELSMQEEMAGARGRGAGRPQAAGAPGPRLGQRSGARRLRGPSHPSPASPTPNPPPPAYGGDDIVQSHTVFLDSHWGVGASVRELVHGVDCPLTAAYMDVVTLYKSMSAPVVHKNAICIFESDSNAPGLRHYDYAFQFYGAVKGHMLTVRAVSEVRLAARAPARPPRPCLCTPPAPRPGSLCHRLLRART
jgi:primary-amine oxidase